MKRAALKAPKRKLKARYLFITGQLFESLGKKRFCLMGVPGNRCFKKKVTSQIFNTGKNKRNSFRQHSSFRRSSPGTI